MQGEGKKFTFSTNGDHVFCVICMRRNGPCILLYEVRKHERRGKATSALGSGGPQAPGDPLRAYGEPNPQPGINAKKQDRRSDPVSYLFSSAISR